MKNKLLVGIAILSISACLATKAQAVQFYDTVGTPYEGAVERLYELEIVSGVSKNTYNADRSVTRAEFAKMMMESALKPSEYKALTTDDANINFDDIDQKAWYYDYVVGAVNGSFMNGYEDASFRPDRTITYAEISKMVTRALGHTYLTPNDPRGWQAEYVDKMYEYHLFDGTVGITSMDDKATRGNVAVIIWNMLTTNTWKMIYRNDVSGFTYVDSGSTLMEQKIVDHTYLLDAHIDGFKEVNGNLNVVLNGRTYKLFDQSVEVNFSMIGGTSDVLLKRVEYPGKKVMFEAVGLSTDIGANLITGTYDQVKAEGYDLTDKTKLSSEADYYYVYTFKNNESKDRVVSVNLNNFYLVENIKISDEKEKADKNEDLSHSEVPKNFEDDVIAYRYKPRYEVLTRTINVNDEELVIADGAVLFKNNKKVNWASIKKGDLLVEVTKDKYYFIVSTTTKLVRLNDYNTKKNEYTIQTSAGEFRTYPSTLYYDYFGNDPKSFNSLKDTTLKNLIGRNIEIALDESDRVIKITLLEDEISQEDLHIGVFDQFVYLDRESEYNEIVLLMDGKKKTYRTTLKTTKVNKGDLVSIKFAKDSKTLVSSVNKISNSLKLTSTLTAKSFKYDDLKKKIKYYDEEKIQIFRTKYYYDFGQYETPKKYEFSTISLHEFNEYEDSKNIEVYAIVDSNDGVLQVFVQDYTDKATKYYGLVTKTFIDNKKQWVQVIQVNGNKETYEVSGSCNVVAGDFVAYEATSKNAVELGEKYTPKVLGYFKDLIVKEKELDKKKKVVEYKLNNGFLNIEDWIIMTDTEEYDLNTYDIFLIKLEKNEKKGVYEFAKVDLVKKTNINLEVGDRIAIDEIDGAIIIYRGYEE